ncbi:MAG TPA: hypothetical protein VG892_13330 [Terriglobales bacterium]|jgi:hypothetical protein|nr:hypothetical protein [Terriglobales bacterium]
MPCTQCKALDQAFELARDKYATARYGAFYRVSPHIAARRQVDMERAKSDRDEHRVVCRTMAITLFNPAA